MEPAPGGGSFSSVMSEAPEQHARPSFPLGGFLPKVRDDQTVEEVARRTPVLSEVDVVVLGGGPAGVCAAVAAARQGSSVLLVERYGFLGGTATAANVNVWHSLYGTDQQTQVIAGLPAEIIERLKSLDACRDTDRRGSLPAYTVSTEHAKFVFDDMVIASGAKLLLHTMFAGVGVRGRRVESVFVETKSGRFAIRAKVFVDCTGDADLVRKAGQPTQLGSESGACQPPTLCFRVGGLDAGQIDWHDLQRELFKGTMDYNGQPFPTFFWGSRGLFRDSDAMVAGVRVLDVNAADVLDLTRAEVEGRYQLRWILDRLGDVPGWQDHYLTDIATQIGLRESHRILADHQLDRDEVLHGVRFDDAVAQGTYPIDIHNPSGPGITFLHLDGTAQRINGDCSKDIWRWDGAAEGSALRQTLCYQVPYRTLIPAALDNVLAAGRCIGADSSAAGAIRVMINAMQFGQAAGTAAALAGSTGAVRSVSVPSLRRALTDQGVPLLPPPPEDPVQPPSHLFQETRT